MKNWKTSLFGTLASIFGTMATIETPYRQYFVAGAGISAVLFSLFSKDRNVTGGTTVQSSEIGGGGIKNPKP